MDPESAEDILKDSLTVFDEDESSDLGTSRITYGPLEITVAPKVRGIHSVSALQWLVLHCFS